MSRNRILAGLLILATILSLAGSLHSSPAQAQAVEARVRFIHAVPGAPEVDVYLDGALIARGVAFGDATPHLNLAGGEHAVALRQSGTPADAAPLLEGSVPLTVGLAYTVVVQGTPTTLETALYEDILDELEPGLARLTAINAIEDAPPLDVLATDGSPLLQGVSYGAQFGTININTSAKDLVMTPAGGALEAAVAEIGAVNLQSGTLYTFVALGTLEGAVAPRVLVLSTPVNPRADSVRVRIAHGSPDAPAVDVYANDILLAPNLALGEMTGHIALPAGDYEVALRVAGDAPDAEPAFSTSVTLAADTPALTVVATGTLAEETLALQAFPNDVTMLMPDMARISVVNAVPGATVGVSTADPDAIELTSALAEPGQSDALDVPISETPLIVTITTEDNELQAIVPAQTYFGGMLYTVLVYGGGPDNVPFDARVGGTELNVTPESLLAEQPVEVAVEPPAEEAPPAEDAGASEVVADDAPPAEDAGSSEIVSDDAPPAEDAGASEVVVDDGPPADSEVVVDDAPPAAAPQATPVPEQPLATVLLDPGANLHCREYPRSDARSLGLIPAGAQVIVVGRTGEPLVPETGNPTPEPTPVVETINDLWISVRWDQPDGGYIRCWVNAAFLQVQYRREFLVDVEELLEVLPEEPFNRPGEAVGTAEQPPTPIFDAVLATVNLEPGVSLQLRRYPNADSEALERVPAQAQLEVLGYVVAPSEGLVGQPTDPNWLRVRYRLENGAAIVGWVSNEYVTLSRLGRPYALEDLPELDPNEPGEFEAAGTPLDIPIEQQDIVGTVNLNPGANLNLRDRPTTDAFVVVGIPSGESVTINGRSGDGVWVQVTYESPTGNLEGWVAVQYLVVTRGGEPWPLADIDIVDDQPDALAP